MSMLLQFKVSSLATAVFPSKTSHILCCKHSDIRPIQHNAKLSDSKVPDSFLSPFTSKAGSLPDGFLVIDVANAALLWFTRSGQRVVRMFSDSSKTLVNPSISPSKANQPPIDGAFCSLQGEQYVAVLNTKLSMILHKIDGWEYFELPLSLPTTKIQSCEFGLLSSVLVLSSPFDDAKIVRKSYQIVTDALAMPVDIVFFNGSHDDTELQEDDVHHEILRVDGDHVLFLTVKTTESIPKHFLTLWRLEKVANKTTDEDEGMVRSRSNTVSSATDHITHGEGDSNYGDGSKVSSLSGGKRRNDRQSPLTMENSTPSITSVYRSSPIHTESQPSSPRTLNQLLGINEVIFNMGRDSSSPLGFIPQTQMPSMQSSLSSNSVKNISTGKFSGRPSPVSHSSSPYSRWNGTSGPVPNISEPAGKVHGPHTQYRFRKLTELPLSIPKSDMDVNVQESSIHAITSSFPPIKTQLNEDIREYSIVFKADPSAVYTFRVHITTNCSDIGDDEHVVISFESRRVSSNPSKLGVDPVSIATVKLHMDGIVPTSSDTLVPSSAIDVSLHLHGSGGLECFIYGYKCDLLFSDQTSLAEEIIAIEDLGGNYILASYRDGRMAVLTVSWPLVFSPFNDELPSDLTVSKAITTDMISYIFKCFSFPPMILGQLINFFEVSHQGIKDENYPLSSCFTPLGWILAICIDSDVDLLKVIGLWESKEPLSTQHEMYVELRQSFSENSAATLKLAVMGFLMNCMNTDNTNRNIFVTKCSVFVKNILSKLQTIGLSVVKEKLEGVGSEFTLGDSLLKVFYRKYDQLITESEKKDTPYVNVLEAFLAAVSWLSNDESVSCSPQESASLVVFNTLPSTIQVAISFSCRLSLLEAKPTWPDWLLQWIGRTDIIATRSPSGYLSELAASVLSSSTSSSSEANKQGDDLNSKEELDGLKMVEKLCVWRFPEDERLTEVSRLLRSSTPHYLRVERAPEVDDKEYRHKQQLKLLSLCRRALATAVGRGMYTIDSLPTSPVSIASSFHDKIPVCYTSLSGRVPPTNAVVNLDTSNAPAELTLWPDFHSGVAAGLRVAPAFDVSRFPYFDKKLSTTRDYNDYKLGNGAKLVSRNWILYNRPVASNYQDVDEVEAARLMDQDSAGYAGTLLGLGLLGHLKALTITDVCDFLTQSQEPMTVGLLIGLASSKIGSADSMLSKTLCLHLPALLPASHWDMEFSPLVQCAALTGLGLLHKGSAHRLMTEFLVAELSRSPSCVEKTDSREAVCLSAGWALGMVLLGRGSESYGEGNLPGNAIAGIVDLGIEDRLQQLIEGGKRPTKFSLFANSTPSVDINSKSSRLLECDDINVNVTSPGACVALGLMYIRTNNKLIASRLALPTTAFALDHIRPDLLIFRSVASCLVDWNGTQPTEEWIMSKIPKVVLSTLEIIHPPQSDGVVSQSKAPLGKRAALQVYLSSVTGLCWGVGLVYAGTMDPRAKVLLITELKMMQRIRDGKPSNVYLNADKPTRPLVDLCLSVISISLGLVLAGSGDIDGLRLLRELRWKAEESTYGSHLAVSMGIGLLFLAGGRASLRRDPTSVGALLLATAPRYPSRTLDHQYHMQAQRHLYVLAIEWRLLRVIDADSGKMISLSIDVVMESGDVTTLTAPCLLTELSSIVEIRLSSVSKNTFIGENLKITEDLLRNHTLPPIFVKQYTSDKDNAFSNKHKDVSVDMLKVSRMAAQYCLDSDGRFDNPNDQSDDSDAMYLEFDNRHTVVPDLSANIAIAMCKFRRRKMKENTESSDTTSMEIDSGENIDQEAWKTAALAQSLDSRAFSMFGY